jgi:LPPG:FO 2-phospho-L-lactate transferase
LIVVLAGGVGAAKFLHGLAAAVPPDEITAIVNTGDDVEFYGLDISPDIDTVLYTLSGRVNPETGWGLAGDTVACLGALNELGEDTWFRLGDRDIATHLVRSSLLRSGLSPTAVTAELASRLGVRSWILPMTDSHFRTFVQTDAGRLPFQEYFVKRGQTDVVKAIEFEGCETAEPTPGVIEALRSAAGLIFAPSNPFVSIGTILAVKGVRQLIESRSYPSVAISPIIGGKALKGPADKMMSSLGHDISAVGVARLYQGLVDVFVIDNEDAGLKPEVEALGFRVIVTNTIMRGLPERERLARDVMQAIR